MVKDKTIEKDRNTLSNHIRTIKNLIGSDKFVDDLIEILDSYSTGNHTLLDDAIYDVAYKHDIIFDYDGNLDEEYADDYHASTKKSKSFNEMVKEQRKQYKNKKVL